MGFSRQEYWSGVPLPSPILYVSILIFDFLILYSLCHVIVPVSCGLLLLLHSSLSSFFCSALYVPVSRGLLLSLHSSLSSFFCSALYVLFLAVFCYRLSSFFCSALFVPVSCGLLLSLHSSLSSFFCSALYVPVSCGLLLSLHSSLSSFFCSALYVLSGFVYSSFTWWFGICSYSFYFVKQLTVRFREKTG